MPKECSRRSFLKAAAVGGAALAAGEVEAEYWENPVCGRVLANGKPLAGVVVTDGRQCAETGKDGMFRIPGRKGVRFISITVPSGWRISRHYIPFASSGRPYIFDLKPWPASKPGPFTFMHIGDSEIDFDIEKEKPWVARAKAFADERDCAFFVHTGDITAALGDAHLRLMNEDTVGRPVFYVVGNHDVVDAEYGERAFERAFGPCWYSFDAGGVHFVVTPMMWGDGTVSYKVDDVVDWLRNDLAIAKRKGQKVIHLVHGAYDNKVFDATKLFSDSKIPTLDSDPFDFAAACDLKAIVHGHLHVNYFRRSKDRRLEVVSAAPPVKGIATLQVLHVDAEARLKAENRYGMGDWRESDETPKGGWLTKVAGIVFCGAPCVADGRVIVGTSDFEGRLPPGAHAFDAKTGRKLWSYETESDVTTRVLADRGRVFVQDEDWRVSALDGKTGRELWKTDLRGPVGLIGARLSGGADSRLGGALTLDPARNRLYVGSAEKSLVALDTASGNIVWRPDAERTNFTCTPSCTVACGDTVVGGIYWTALYGYDQANPSHLGVGLRHDYPVGVVVDVVGPTDLASDDFTAPFLRGEVGALTMFDKGMLDRFVTLLGWLTDDDLRGRIGRGDIDGVRGVLARFSPNRMVTKDSPPTVFAYCRKFPWSDTDGCVPTSAYYDLKSRLTAAGVPHRGDLRSWRIHGWLRAGYEQWVVDSARALIDGGLASQR